ncbi:PREDICTED: hydroxylysine kinase [Nicrophorus vespilloides]|uniref:Hydroxylysine kinase n=1 Tax=Nicrophorus vespilloides TaxID=110193 RepID=A0ABM1MPH9_NICVS|nr:PREDICTED: hydroxylysine kinase [Nicrophorus vespilloides]
MTTLLEPGVEIRPIIESEKCVKLIEDLYGFPCKNLSELNGYDDRNFKVQIGEETYVLKIMNSLDSKNLQNVEGQNSMMLFLYKNGIKCPTPITNKEKMHYSVVDLESGRHVVRLMTYLKGKIFHEIPCYARIFFEAGQFIARIDTALESFTHTSYESYKTLWMLDSVPQLRQFVHAVDKNERRRKLEVCINEFEKRVSGNSFPRGFIHGDFNEQNIVVVQENRNWRISGILDFGDSHKSCYLYELAVAMTYMMIVGHDVTIGGHVLAGYQSIRNVSQEEISLLKVCVMGRLCQSLILGAYTSLQHPENSDYLLVTAAPGWELFEKMYDIEEEKILKIWLDICDDYRK